jgi:spore coat polysaccharide biosynthesis predicted glycosyltransferase SpsG
MSSGSPRKILLIGKGGKGLGMGHIIRLGSLYELFRRRYNIELLLNNDRYAVEFAVNRKYKFRIYNNFTQMLQLIAKAGPYDILFFDMLRIPISILKNAKKYCSSLLVFDDMHRLAEKDMDAGIICPQDTFRNKVRHKNATTIFSGTDYFPLRKDVKLYRKQKRYNKEVRNILISLGGKPPLGQTMLVARLLDRHLDENIKIHLLLGHNKRTKIKDFSGRVILHGADADVASLILKSDLGIIAAGFTKFEFICIGTPFFMFSLNYHQRVLAEKFSSKGYGIYLGDIADLSKNIDGFYSKVDNLILNPGLRKGMYLQNRKLMDGNQDARYLNLVNELLK